MSARMVLVALDAVDLTLLRRGVDAGEMPVMGDLLSRGSFGRLDGGSRSGLGDGEGGGGVHQWLATGETRTSSAVRAGAGWGW